MLITITILFMNKNILSNMANINAHNAIITPSTTIIIEISMVNAIIPSIMLNTRTVATTITVAVVVTVTTITMIAINIIIIIITSTRRFFMNISMRTNPIMTTITIYFHNHEYL